LKNFLDEMLGFGPRNQHIGRYVKRQAVEFLLAGDVLDGLTVTPTLKHREIGVPLVGPNFDIGMGD
jgi:hypothetical protein